jgi:hypothetical protein
LAAVHVDLQRLLAKDLLPDVTAVPLADLRQLRVACSAAEGDVSFVRRVAQGRLDIVGHEVRRRSGAADDAPELNGILFDLPDILTLGAPGSGGATSARMVAIQEPGLLAQALLSDLDQAAAPSELTSANQLADDRLASLLEDLRAFEVELSTNRRRLHERIDSIQGEIARRYRDGEASIDSLLN